MAQASSTRSSTERLVTELTILAADDHRVSRMIHLARRGAYSDIRTVSATPKIDLVRDLRELGHEDLARRAMAGEFDSSREEWDSGTDA